VIAEHPEDVSLRVKGEGEETLVDGFEFGKETITFVSAGRYRIDIGSADSSSKSAGLEIHMSRNAISLQAAADWKAAEGLAINSKHSPQVPTILASLERWQALKDPPSIARTWLKLGDAVLSTGDLSRAHEAYEHALEICSTMGDTRCRAEAANNSGHTAQQLGDLSDAFTRLDEAAQGWQEISRPLEQGKTLSNLGILYSRTGDFRRAISTYDRAGTILRTLDPLAYAKVLNNLGLCFVALAEYEPAKIYFYKAIAVEEKMPGARGDWIRARLNLGRTLMLQGQLQRARALIEEVVKDTQTWPDRTLRAFAVNNLGQTWFRLGVTDAAESRLKEALDLHGSSGDKRGEAIAYHYLGLIARKRGDIAAARESLTQALDIRRTRGLRDDAVDSLYALAELEFTAGDAAPAQSLAEEAISLLEFVRSSIPSAGLRAAFYARRRNLLDLLVAIAMRSNNPNAVSDGFLASELGRSRALLDIVGERDRSSPRPPDLMVRQARIRKEINFLSLLAADESKRHESVKERLQALLAEEQQVEARIRESIESRESAARPLASVNSLQQMLSSRRAIVEYHLGERHSYLWLVRDQSIEVFTLPSRAVIERQISTAVRLFGKPRDRRASPALQEQFVRAMKRLSATLLGQLQQPLLPPQLILILDGDLHRVPFAALRLPSGEYLGIQHDLLRAPSAAFLQHSSQRGLATPFRKAVLVVYDPIFSLDDQRVPPAFRKPQDGRRTSFARLPFTEELQTIAGLVPPARRDFLRGFDASVPRLRSLPLDQYGVLYFSTHAVINDEIPELSRIALSVVDRKGHSLDGFLFSHQLADLHLNHATVVLSACETALGKKVMGEGLAGFSSSLFAAGASQLVLTVSEVDAQASSVLVSETFRRAFAPHPETMEHALRLAQRSFLRSQWSDPYYWASFVVVGSPTLEASQ
jgi:CHAT domain-containing protein/tetratricopeptide (TPR) repeat protein